MREILHVHILVLSVIHTQPISLTQRLQKHRNGLLASVKITNKHDTDIRVMRIKEVTAASQEIV